LEINEFFNRPTGAAAPYLIEVGKTLASGPSGDAEETDKKEKRLTELYKILNLDEAQLKACQHPTDITKTCRSIVMEF
jgi:hypothetical protein